MPWAKFTDGLDENDKLAGITDAAFRLWVLSITWSNRKLTDGHIPTGRPMRLVSLRNPKKTTAELVEAKLWHVASRPCKACLQQRAEKRVTDPIPSGGWIVHDYFHFQKAKWVIEAERERLRSIGAKGGKASTQLSTELSSELSTELELPAKHAAQAPSSAGSSSTELGIHGVETEHAARPRTPVVPVPPSSGAIAPVSPEDPFEPEDGSLKRSEVRGGRRESGLHHAGSAFERVADSVRKRAG